MKCRCTNELQSSTCSREQSLPIGQGQGQAARDPQHLGVDASDLKGAMPPSIGRSRRRRAHRQDVLVGEANIGLDHVQVLGVVFGVGTREVQQRAAWRRGRNTLCERVQIFHIGRQDRATRVRDVKAAVIDLGNGDLGGQGVPLF